MVTVKPAGLSGTTLTANQVSLTVSFLEQFRPPRRCRNMTPIQITVSYSTGSPVIGGAAEFVPVVAIVTAVYLMCDGTTKLKTFAEQFDISFQGQDLISSSVVINSLGRTSKATTSCCGITNLTLDDSITITVS